VAEALTVSPRTVQKHLEHIYDKLRVRGRTAAAALAAPAPADAPVRPMTGATP
jgi:DNA-binding CsgD family transcriptional regulator